MTTAAIKSTSDSALSSLTLGVFSLTLFLSASIMFAIQPMTGKMLLPIVGGTPAGWIVAMAFFQIMLLAGYLLAHGLSKFPPRVHAALYIVALVLGISFMPVDIRAHADIAGANPEPFDVFLLLSRTLAVPFIALSATSSTIQRLFTSTGHKSAGDPYFLYVASNIGSFAGLLLYPFVFEPLLSLSEQSGYSSIAYTALMVAGAACFGLSLLNGRKAPAAETVAVAAIDETTPDMKKRYLEWMALSFVPSSLLLGVTIYITTDIMSVPMIWVLPLCLYLLTFILAFAKKQFISLQALQRLQPAAVLVGITLICMTQISFLTEWSGILFYLAIFMLVALACHLKLASLRPVGMQSRHLTGFYLMMSVGGALGGVLNAFIIPQITDRLIEFPLILVVSLLFLPAFKAQNRYGKTTIAALCLTALTLYSSPPQLSLRPVDVAEILFYLAAFALILCGVYSSVRTKVLRAEGVIALSAIFLFISQFLMTQDDVIYSDRNFYGTIRVHERVLSQKDGPDYVIRFIRHGTTLHGSQIVAPEQFSKSQTSYYHPTGDLFSATRGEHVAVIGLGAGVINCYEAPNRHFTFFEIDPAVVDVARNHFTFLSKCQSAEPSRIIIGDGRLELGKLKNETFDLIIVDAFSSDAIPMHLLTKEALQEYIDRAGDDGIVAFHISNRYFKLDQQIAGAAKELGLHQLIKVDTKKEIPFRYPSVWVVVSRKDYSGILSPQDGWTRVIHRGARVWTDDYSNIMSAFYTPKRTHIKNRKAEDAKPDQP